MRTPTILHMEAAECGAAALGIVLGYYGRNVALEELRVACGVSRDGSKASNIVRAARRYGLVAQGVKADLNGLRAVPLPAILHWNFNHFLVLEGFARNRIYLNDPAQGPRIASFDELNRSFTGVALIFDIGSEFQRGGTKPNLIWALWQRLTGVKVRLLIAILAALLLVVPGILLPFFTGIFVDNVLVPGSSASVHVIVVAMAGIAAAAACLTFAQRSSLLRLQNTIAIRESRSFLRHVLRLPMSFYLQRTAGEVGSRVAINDRFARLLSGDLATSTLSVLMIAFYAVVMAHYDAVLTSIGVIAAMLNFVALRYVSRMRKDAYRKVLQGQGKLTGASMAGLRRIESLKASGGELDFFARWAGQHTLMVNTEQEFTVVTEALSSLPVLLAGLSTTAILTIGGLRVIDGHLSIGMLVAFQVLMAGFLAPVSQLINVGTQLQELEAGMNRLDDVLRHPEDPELLGEQVGGIEMSSKELTGQVELRNVAFGYSTLAPPLIDDFNLTLRPGDRVALVGATGSGRSTIARLVTGLYQPWSGEILFDGKPRSQVPRRVITHGLAMVDQDIVLLDGTVRQNLTLWDDSVADTDIVQAAADACIHDDILARPNGYDSLIEERGRNLSGGQAQRLEIARALVRNPRVLVLDEATSALDPRTEQHVSENLQWRGCTCLIIAHRLSTIRDCDEIIVLERGRVVQRGSHDELAATDGPYSRLIRSETIDSGPLAAQSNSRFGP